MTNYAGMTLNERLSEAGKLDEFDRLIKKNRFRDLKKLLLGIGLRETEAEYAAEQVLQTRNGMMSR
jgi:hypothetical protein